MSKRSSNFRPAWHFVAASMILEPDCCTHGSSTATTACPVGSQDDDVLPGKKSHGSSSEAGRPVYVHVWRLQYCSTSCCLMVGSSGKQMQKSSVSLLLFTYEPRARRIRPWSRLKLSGTYSSNVARELKKRRAAMEDRAASSNPQPRQGAGWRYPPEAMSEIGHAVQLQLKRFSQRRRRDSYVPDR